MLGLVGIFPTYIGSAGSGSLLSQADQVVPHLAYVIGWAVCAAMIALSSARPATARLGALFGLGLSAFAGRSFITANGAPEMLAASAAQGWRTVPSNDEDGVAVAIDELLAND